MQGTQTFRSLVTIAPNPPFDLERACAALAALKERPSIKSFHVAPARWVELQEALDEDRASRTALGAYVRGGSAPVYVDQVGRDWIVRYSNGAFEGYVDGAYVRGGP